MFFEAFVVCHDSHSRHRPMRIRGWCRARCVLSSFVGDQSTGAAFKCIRALGQNVGSVALFRNYALRAVLAFDVFGRNSVTG
ncbi:unnamed protein product [Microthlaspi erraticum]|uniref:Uncharacterized protein n=1 Tax=Microthlaspi erraticum TaxID=1685480 RepID=A0A6D2HHJ8_9BRAS|nr:unnamed protein product [Microthlaspi erraticum]